MRARLLDGRPLAAAVTRATAAQVAARGGRAPCLAVVRGDAAAAESYCRRIAATAEDAGVLVRMLDAPSSAEAASALIYELAEDVGVDGILPLSPLPATAMAAIVAALPPAKDVDGLTAANAGRLAHGADGLFPCTAQGALHLARHAAGDIRGRTATVVGASATVGRPLAEMLLRAGATVTVAHADTRDLPAACRSAELLFVAVGKAGLIGAGHVAPGAIVIDIGINAVPAGDGSMRIVGDADADAVVPIAGALSLVPDGVGPLTAAYVIRNCVKAASLR